MRTTIAWGDGSGDNIYLDYTAASGDQTILVSSDANAGETARTKNITFSASGASSVTLTVAQAAQAVDLIVITYNGTCIVRNEVGIGYPYALPSAYKALEYVTMTSLIDTNQKTTNKSRIEGKIYCTQEAASYLWYSDSSSSGTSNTTAYYSTSGNWRFGNRTFSIAAYTKLRNKVVEITQDASGVTIDGVTEGTYASISTFTSSANLRFGSSSSSVSIRHYYFRHYINDVAVSWMIPAKRISDGVAGFYDFIAGAFFAGGTAGPEIND